MNKTNKNYKRSQRGRSMVEMLGVLAIVGVLSVGGVYGYGVAMKKHKANELLHQASMLATTISAQAMTNDGKLPETITSFGNTSYGTFSTSTTDALDGKGFAITIENVDSGACTQLEKMAGGMVRDVDCDEATGNATITYYKNLATTEAEGEKSPTGRSSDTIDPLCKDVKCETGQQCIGGACAEVSACIGDCQNCYYDEEYNEICDDTIGCSKKSDCDKWCETNGNGVACYCAINADYTENDSACYNNFKGQCAVATTQSGVTGGYTVSAKTMNWWSAVNFCKAHDKSLVSLADLGISGGYQDDGECGREEGDNCTGTVDWSDLYSKIGGEKYDPYWTTDAVSCDVNGWACTAGTNNNSCSAFFVNLSSGTVTGGQGRNSDSSLYALCE